MSCTTCGSGSHSTRRHETFVSNAKKVKKTITVGPTSLRPWTSLPLWDGAELPLDADVIGGSTEQQDAFRIPVAHFLPGGLLNPIRYTSPQGASAVVVPFNQVVPVFRADASLPFEKAVASSTQTLAQDLAIKATGDEITIQGQGYIVFPRVHPYMVGRTYYLSQEVPGEVISVKPSSGVVQPLFTVIDQTTIRANVQLGV